MFFRKKNQQENREKGFIPLEGILGSVRNVKKLSRGKRKYPLTGFTLVELIVSMGLFTVVMLGAVGALLTMLDANKKAMAIRSAMDGLGFGLEDIGREVRVGWNYECSSGVPTDGWVAYVSAPPPTAVVPCGSTGGLGFRMTTNIGTVLYYREAGKIKKSYKAGASSGNTDYFGLDMTPDGVVVDENKPSFYVLPLVAVPPTRQPYVIINLDGTVGTGLKASLATKFHIQTIVTARMPNGTAPPTPI